MSATPVDWKARAEKAEGEVATIRSNARTRSTAAPRARALVNANLVGTEWEGTVCDLLLTLADEVEAKDCGVVSWEEEDARSQAKIEALEARLDALAAFASSEVAAVEAERDEARAALEKHGGHDGECALQAALTGALAQCRCGLDAAMKGTP